MITAGPYTITPFIYSTLRLDGGAMFGSVPKTIWSRAIQPDAENCIPLVSRSLLIKGGGRTILVDLGCGEKWSEKQRAIFAIANTPADRLPFDRDSVTDVILTHLHFDHAGGVSFRAEGDGELQLSFPRAKHYLQRANLELAKSPSIRERASYLKDNIDPLADSDLVLIDGSREILPGIFAHRIDGHTMGQQWIEIADDKQPVYFPSDLIPTAHHLPLPYIMGYDMCPRESLKEREMFLELASTRSALVVFQHDRGIVGGELSLDAKGNYAMNNTVRE
jgi:glyoxylase-like metal-dependent hydrolase (beta-lactamase superfamily II)